MSNLHDPEDIDEVERDYIIAIRRASNAGDNDLAQYYSVGLQEYRDYLQNKGLR